MITRKKHWQNTNSKTKSKNTLFGLEWDQFGLGRSDYLSLPPWKIKVLTLIPESVDSRIALFRISAIS